MKTNRFFTALLWSLCVCTTALATHNRAGEITYKRIAPFTKMAGTATVPVYNYSITVYRYTNFGPGFADRCVDTVEFGDGQEGVAPRINGQACGDCGSTVTCGYTLANVQTPVRVSIYSIIHEYKQAGIFLIRSFDPNRSPDIHNVPNSVNSPFYIESLLVINNFTGANSSPVINTLPVGNATLNACYLHHPGAYDADGDSLSYEITTCRGAGGQTIPGYAFPETGVNGYYGINAVTGDFGWCNPQQLGVYALAYLVKEHRKNTSGKYELTGYVLRDMEVEVVFAPVGVVRHSLFGDMIIAPNPVHEQLEVSLERDLHQEVSYAVYSVNGSLVGQARPEPVSDHFLIDVGDLSPGIYFLRIQSSLGSAWRKVIKE